jgi:NhaA family Na+:H+ antiporter
MATFQAGIHATIAGAVLGILAPPIPFQRPRAVSDEAHRVAEQTVDDPEPPDADAQEWLRLAALSREAVSPLARLEALLHPWTSYVVIPLFALANAGVRLSGAGLSEGAAVRVVLGIMVGLVVGKPLGIAAFAWLGARMGWVELPAGARWNQLVGVAAVAGIGFTVSLFISELALGSGGVGQAAKVGIVSASCIAAAVGAVLIRLSGGGRDVTDSAPRQSDPGTEAGASRV